MFPRVGRCDEFNGNVEDMWKQFHALQERMYKTSGTTVSSAMHEATTVTRRRPLVEATEIMLAENVARVPVVNEKGTLVGILSRGDIMRRTFRAFMLARQNRAIRFARRSRETPPLPTRAIPPSSPR